MLDHLPVDDGVVVQQQHRLGSLGQRPMDANVDSSRKTQVLRVGHNRHRIAKALSKLLDGIVAGTIINDDDLHPGRCRGLHRLYALDRIFRQVPVQDHDV